MWSAPRMFAACSPPLITPSGFTPSVGREPCSFLGSSPPLCGSSAALSSWTWNSSSAGGTKSAVKTSLTLLARVEVQTTFFPSGENEGSPSKPSFQVTRTSLKEPSVLRKKSWKLPRPSEAE